MTHMTIARSYLGTKEIKGSADNPKIIGWQDELEAAGLGRVYAGVYRHDAIPWCGLFVGHCLLNAGISGPKNPLSALAWADWGDEVPFSEREAGCVLVFTRQGGGHVGFYAGEDADGSALDVLGGNQSDAVSISRIATDRLHAVRWPAGLARRKSGLLTQSLSTSLSGNEA